MKRLAEQEQKNAEVLVSPMRTCALYEKYLRMERANATLQS
jgi:hypothetical protein